MYKTEMSQKRLDPYPMKLKIPFRKKSASQKGRDSVDTHFELWSRDTFEGRTFLCAVFDNYEDARAALNQCRMEALSQDEELRDSYWLAGTDIANILERERRERERSFACRREEEYNPEHLRTVCDRAADRFAEFLRKNERHPILRQNVGGEWNHSDDCFNKISFEMGRSDAHGVFFVSLWVWIRASAHYQGGGISSFVLDGPTIDGLCEKLRELETREMLFAKACHLIKRYFEGDRP